MLLANFLPPPTFHSQVSSLPLVASRSNPSPTFSHLLALMADPHHIPPGNHAVGRMSALNSPLPSRSVVFVTGRGGVGFHFVTPLLLRPGVNSLPFLPAPYDTGPWPGCGAGLVFYFPR